MLFVLSAPVKALTYLIMLRAKQLGTLSQSARSFFLSGSRCAADGSSCTCSEDETCVSGRPQRKNEVPHSQISSTITSKPVGVGSAIPGDAGKVLNCQKPVKPIRTVDRAKSTNARVANAKMVRVEKGHPEVHLETAAGSSATKNFSVAKGGVDKPTPVKRDDTGY